MNQQRREKRKKIGRGKEEQASRTRIYGEHTAIITILMTQQWSSVTMYLRLDCLEARTKAGIWVHMIYWSNILRNIY